MRIHDINNNMIKENKMKIKKEARGCYHITKGNNKYEVICGEETQGWKINDLNCADMDKWMHTVERLYDAKLLIANDFDFDKAFGGY